MDICDLADKATRSVLGRNAARHSPQDWEDARQEAAEAIIIARLNGYDREGALFLAAKHRLFDWMRVVIRQRAALQLLDWRCSESVADERDGIP